MRLYTLLKKACQIIGSLGYDNRVNASLTRNSTYVPSTSTAECYIIKGEGRCYFRCKIEQPRSVNIPANTDIVLYTVSAAVRPPYGTALSVYCTSITPIDVIATAEGHIRLRAKGDGVSTGHEIFISGSWRYR